MTEPADAVAEQGSALLSLYDAALPQVYGYLFRRCGSVAVAEDLTSETFVAAVDAVRRDRVPSLTLSWLIGVARHKLVDHWRRLEREHRLFDVIEGALPDVSDDWDALLDAATAHDTLAQLGPHHRGALTLRYVDGLPVAEVARHIGRSVGATEVLLVRARRAFRTVYETGQREEDR